MKNQETKSPSPNFPYKELVKREEETRNAIKTHLDYDLYEVEYTEVPEWLMSQGRPENQFIVNNTKEYKHKELCTLKDLPEVIKKYGEMQPSSFRSPSEPESEDYYSKKWGTTKHIVIRPVETFNQ